MLRASEREAIVAYYREMDASFAHWGRPGAYEMHYGYKTSPASDHFDALARMNAVVAELADVRAGDVVLDAGCGVGATSLWLVEHGGVSAHGVSLSPLQVGKAAREAALRGVGTRAAFSVQDYTATDFAAGSFDVVWAMESLCHAPRKDEFLAEALRLLRRGGRIAIADYFRARAALRPEERSALRAWADGWAMALPPPADRFRRRLEQAGFRDVRCHDLTPYIEPDAAEMHRRGRGGLAEDLAHASPRRLAHVRACMAQKLALDRGLWRYLVFTGTR